MVTLSIERLFDFNSAPTDRSVTSRPPSALTGQTAQETPCLTLPPAAPSRPTSAPQITLTN